MSPPTSAEQRAKIETLLADGKIPRKDIGKHVDPPVCYGTVVRIQRNLKKYGTTNKPRQGVVGRPAKITEPMAQAVLEALTEKPEMYLEELARVLHDEFDEWVSVATLSRYLKKEGWVKEKDGENCTPPAHPASVRAGAGAAKNKTTESESESSVTTDEGQDEMDQAVVAIIPAPPLPMTPELQQRLQKLNNSAMRFFSATLSKDPTADLSPLFEKYRTLYPARRERAHEKSAATVDVSPVTTAVQRVSHGTSDNVVQWSRRPAPQPQRTVSPAVQTPVSPFPPAQTPTDAKLQELSPTPSDQSRKS
ncbi:unnamed protein product [Tuber aestivum]|uniref:Uncharacterized protein n=1 Tax=Tuber aestivum TaxID=59557 RepID=A0A292Q4C7_9PEZI|nr:unnamed protein product [Tuber aestivum]